MSTPSSVPHEHREVELLDLEWFRIARGLLEPDSFLLASNGTGNLEPVGKLVHFFREGYIRHLKKLNEVDTSVHLLPFQPKWTSFRIRQQRELGLSLTDLSHRGLQYQSTVVGLMEVCRIVGATYHRRVPLGATAEEEAILKTPADRNNLWSANPLPASRKGLFIRLTLQRCSLDTTDSDPTISGIVSPLPEITTIDCHLDAGCADFIIERKRYRRAISQGWKTGDRFKMFWASDDDPSVGDFYAGVVLGLRPVDVDDPSSSTSWESIKVRWDEEDDRDPEDDTDYEMYRYVSPWEIQPEKPTRRSFRLPAFDLVSDDEDFRAEALAHELPSEFEDDLIPEEVLEMELHANVWQTGDLRNTRGNSDNSRENHTTRTRRRGRPLRQERELEDDYDLSLEDDDDDDDDDNDELTGIRTGRGAQHRAAGNGTGRRRGRPPRQVIRSEDDMDISHDGSLSHSNTRSSRGADHAGRAGVAANAGAVDNTGVKRRRGRPRKHPRVDSGSDTPGTSTIRQSAPPNALLQTSAGVQLYTSGVRPATYGAPRPATALAGLTPSTLAALASVGQPISSFPFGQTTALNPAPGVAVSAQLVGVQAGGAQYASRATGAGRCAAGQTPGPAPQGILATMQRGSLGMPGRKQLPVTKGDWNAFFCSECHDGGNLVCCDGTCLRAFHLNCLPAWARPNSRSNEAWYCPLCQMGLAQCAVCGLLGRAGDAVVKCSLDSCGRYYHPTCLLKLMPRLYFKIMESSPRDLTLNQLTTFVDGNRADKRVFQCPAHFCQHCHMGAESSKLLPCWICPRAWHSHCLPHGTTTYSEDKNVDCPWCASVYNTEKERQKKVFAAAVAAQLSASGRAPQFKPNYRRLEAVVRESLLEASAATIVEDGSSVLDLDQRLIAPIRQGTHSAHVSNEPDKLDNGLEQARVGREPGQSTDASAGPALISEQSPPSTLQIKAHGWQSHAGTSYEVELPDSNLKYSEEELPNWLTQPVCTYYGALFNRLGPGPREMLEEVEAASAALADAREQYSKSEQAYHERLGERVLIKKDLAEVNSELARLQSEVTKALQELGDRRVPGAEGSSCGAVTMDDVKLREEQLSEQTRKIDLLRERLVTLEEAIGLWERKQERALEQLVAECERRVAGARQRFADFEPSGNAINTKLELFRLKARMQQWVLYGTAKLKRAGGTRRAVPISGTCAAVLGSTLTIEGSAKVALQAVQERLRKKWDDAYAEYKKIGSLQKLQQAFPPVPEEEHEEEDLNETLRAVRIIPVGRTLDTKVLVGKTHWHMGSASHAKGGCMVDFPLQVQGAKLHTRLVVHLNGLITAQMLPGASATHSLLLNGCKVPENEPVTLYHGDMLQVGADRFKVDMFPIEEMNVPVEKIFSPLIGAPPFIWQYVQKILDAPGPGVSAGSAAPCSLPSWTNLPPPPFNPASLTSCTPTVRPAAAAAAGPKASMVSPVQTIITSTSTSAANSTQHKPAMQCVIPHAQAVQGAVQHGQGVHAAALHGQAAQGVEKERKEAVHRAVQSGLVVNGAVQHGPSHGLQKAIHGASQGQHSLAQAVGASGATTSSAPVATGSLLGACAAALLGNSFHGKQAPVAAALASSSAAAATPVSATFGLGPMQSLLYDEDPANPAPPPPISSPPGTAAAAAVVSAPLSLSLGPRSQPGMRTTAAPAANSFPSAKFPETGMATRSVPAAALSRPTVISASSASILAPTHMPPSQSLQALSHPPVTANPSLSVYQSLPSTSMAVGLTPAAAAPTRSLSPKPAENLNHPSTLSLNSVPAAMGPSGFSPLTHNATDSSHLPVHSVPVAVIPSRAPLPPTMNITDTSSLPLNLIPAPCIPSTAPLPPTMNFTDTSSLPLNLISAPCIPSTAPSSRSQDAEQSITLPISNTSASSAALPACDVTHSCTLPLQSNPTMSDSVSLPNSCPVSSSPAEGCTIPSSLPLSIMHINQTMLASQPSPRPVIPTASKQLPPHLPGSTTVSHNAAAPMTDPPTPVVSGTPPSSLPTPADQGPCTALHTHSVSTSPPTTPSLQPSPPSIMPQAIHGLEPATHNPASTTSTAPPAAQTDLPHVAHEAAPITSFTSPAPHTEMAKAPKCSAPVVTAARAVGDDSALSPTDVAMHEMSPSKTAASTSGIPAALAASAQHATLPHSTLSRSEQHPTLTSSGTPAATHTIAPSSAQGPASCTLSHNPPLTSTVLPGTGPSTTINNVAKPENTVQPASGEDAKHSSSVTGVNAASGLIPDRADASSRTLPVTKTAVPAHMNSRNKVMTGLLSSSTEAALMKGMTHAQQSHVPHATAAGTARISTSSHAALTQAGATHALSHKAVFTNHNLDGAAVLVGLSDTTPSSGGTHHRSGHWPLQTQSGNARPTAPADIALNQKTFSASSNSNHAAVVASATPSKPPADAHHQPAVPTISSRESHQPPAQPSTSSQKTHNPAHLRSWLAMHGRLPSKPPPPHSVAHTAISSSLLAAAMVADATPQPAVAPESAQAQAE